MKKQRGLCAVTERASRLQSELEAALRAAADVPTADCLRADMAANLARMGQIEPAERILADIRSRYEAAPHKRVTPWLNFAEAFLDFQRGHGDLALVKLQRSYALSVLSALPLAPFAAASLAHAYWNRGNVDRSVHYAKAALASSNLEDHRTLCRVSALVGEMLALALDERASRPWFSKAHRHAVASGDDLALSALAFNMWIIRLNVLLQRVLTGRGGDRELKQAAAHARSSNALDSLLHIPSGESSEMGTAQLLSLFDRHSDALAIYESRINTLKLASAGRRRSLWLSDIAWCLANVGRLEDATRVAREATEAISSAVQIDDLAATHSRLALTYLALGDATKASFYQAIADRKWREYETFQDHCAALCKPFSTMLVDL